MLKQGPPPKQGRTGKSIQYIGIFIVVGLILYALVAGNAGYLDKTYRALFSIAGSIFPQMLISTLFAGLVSAIQAWILREHLESKNLLRFIGFAVLGGAVSGLVAGLAMNILNSSSGFVPGLLMGGLAGAIAGAISSAGQNTFMSSAGHQGQWMTYSIISWMLIWGFGWGISWQIGYIVGTSTGAVLMMVTSGVAILVFLSKTAIEF